MKECEKCTTIIINEGLTNSPAKLKIGNKSGKLCESCVKTICLLMNIDPEEFYKKCLVELDKNK